MKNRSAATQQLVARAVERSLVGATPETWLGVADRIAFMGDFLDKLEAAKRDAGKGTPHAGS